MGVLEMWMVNIERYRRTHVQSPVEERASRLEERVARQLPRAMAVFNFLDLENVPDLVFIPIPPDNIHGKFSGLCVFAAVAPMVYRAACVAADQDRHGGGRGSWR